MAPAVSQLRRDLPAAIDRPAADRRTRGRAGQRLVPWAARLGRRRAHYGDELSFLAQLEIGSPTATDQGDHRRDVDGRTVGHHRQRPLRRAVRRRPARADAWLEPGVLRRRLGRGAQARLRPRPPHALCRTPGPPPGGVAARTDLDVARGQDARGLRPEPGRLGRVRGAGPARQRRHGSARGGARARRTGRPAAAHGLGHRRFILSGGTTSSSRPSPSTASATPRSTAGPGRARRPTRLPPSSCQSDLRRTGNFECSDRCSTSSTAMWSGACAATSSTCRPTARSATNGWGGPVTSRLSRPPRPTCSTSRASLRDWLRDLAPSSARSTEWSRSWCPTCSST